MKHSWNSVPLGTIIKHRKSFVEIEDQKRYKLCRVQTKSQGVVLREEKDGADIKTKKQQVCRTGDLIFAEMDARFGGYGIVPPDLNGAIVSSHYFLYEINTDLIDRQYLSYCLTQPWFQSQIVAKGSTNYAAIRPYQVLEYEIPLPAIAIQRALVSKIELVRTNLSKIDKLRKSQEQDIRNLLFSRYTDIIKNAKWEPMSAVAPIVRRDVTIDENGLYPEVGLRSFGKGTFHKPSLTGIEVGTKTLYQIKQGDLMFSNVFAWEGAIAVAKSEDNDRYGSHRFISCVVDQRKAHASFLWYHFLTPKGLEDINHASPGGAGRNKTLGLDKLMKILVPIPDLDEQLDFVNLLTKINALRLHHRDTEIPLKELTPSLLDKAFKGD